MAVAKVRKAYIQLLKPYLVGEQPKPNGEMDMHCPLHDDATRSANLNIETGVWFCHRGCGGGRVAELIRRKDEWVDPPNAAYKSSKPNSGDPAEHVTEAKIVGWLQALQADDKALAYLMDKRGLSNDTILDYEIGWDKKFNAYTIPIRGPHREFWNVRRYDPNPKDDRRKIWSIKNMGTPTLYPVSLLRTDPEYYVVCEGEFDALVTIQHGFPAITRTGAAKVWNGQWSEHFAGKTVYVCHDMDKAGQDGNRRVERALRKVTKEVKVIHLPYKIKEKHGKDLTDYFREHTADDFRQLLHSAPVMRDHDHPEDTDPSDSSVLESFDARSVGKPLRLIVTVKGRKDPGYSIPEKAHLTCTRDAGEKCNFCPMNAAGGDDKLKIEPYDPVVLELIEATKPQVFEILRKQYGAMKCNRLEIDPGDRQAVEVLFARPSVEHVNGNGAGDYKTVKITSVGKHDTMPNNTIRVVGALQPDPRRQLNEFQAWEVEPLETTLDNFELDKKMLKSLKRFQPKRGQTPLQKLGEISRAMERHVTHIYGRPEMHALMDLTWHAALAFEFGGQIERKGWLDSLVVGDTRTGKSEAATRLAQHFGAGEIISCESASFAGVVGGLQQYGAGKEWSVSWGVVPLNDRRLVVLDEIGGLEIEEIAQLSDVRSRGIAQLTKIQQEQTSARTRLLWLGNPRNSRMADYTYGVQAIKPLIGNNEDIARFDLAMSVRAGEVSMKEINREHEVGTLRYTPELCRSLVRWCWSRTSDQIRFQHGSQQAIYKHATRLGANFVEDPPLVQAANVRIKIARVAVALAGRLFSTRDGENLLISKQHVESAVAFIELVYGMEGFGYAERSKELIEDRQQAVEKKRDVRKFLRTRRGLAKFLRGTGHFRRQDLEEILDIQREEANNIISTLWESRMIRKDKGNVMIEPTLHELLREIK